MFKLSVFLMNQTSRLYQMSSSVTILAIGLFCLLLIQLCRFPFVVI